MLTDNLPFGWPFRRAHWRINAVLFVLVWHAEVEKICGPHWSAELFAPAENPDCSISIVYVSLQSVGGRIETEAGLGSLK